MKFFIYTLLLLLLSGLALAVPPFSLQENEKGLQVLHPEETLLKHGSDAALFFHVFNSSGYPLNSTLVGCVIDVYNKSNGGHVEEASLSVYSNNEFKHALNMSRYEMGQYGYVVVCSPLGGQVEYGYSGGNFFLSNSGEVVENDAFIIAAVLILLPLLFGWMLLQWLISLGDDHSEIKIVFSIASLMTVLMSLWFAVVSVNRLMSWAEMQDVIGWHVWMFGILFLVIITYFIIYLVVAVFNAMAQKKLERLRY